MICAALSITIKLSLMWIRHMINCAQRKGNLEAY